MPAGPHECKHVSTASAAFNHRPFPPLDTRQPAGITSKAGTYRTSLIVPGTVVATLADGACMARPNSLMALTCTLLRAGPHYWHHITLSSEIFFSALHTYRPDLLP